MKILIQTCKDDVVYYNASTIEQLHKAALKILEQNMEDGFYHVPAMPEPLGFDLARIEGLPTRLCAEADRLIAETVRAIQEHDIANTLLNAIKKILEEKKGAAAWLILKSRARYEYERVELREPIEL